MTTPNWKQLATGSIREVTDFVTNTTIANDDDLANQLRAAIEQGVVAGVKNIEFAKSLLDGFERFGGFTDRQRPFVERMLVPSPDVELAARLRAAVESGALAHRGEDFARSLLAGFLQWGGFTDRQRPHVERMLREAQPAVASVATATVPATPIAAPTIAPPWAYTGLTGLVNLDKFARFTVGDLQLTLKNDGTLIWVKWHGVLAGSIDSVTGHYRPSRKHLSDAEQKACVVELMSIDRDPKGAAQAYGIATGRCSCCGRPLTDPVSISFGIGPVCRSRGWGL